MKSSPADVIKKILIEEQLVSDPESVGAPWPCYVSSLPDASTPDNAACLYDTSPKLDGRLMRTGESVEHPGVQVKVRSKTYREGWAKIDSISTKLDAVLRRSLVIEDFNYTVQSISTGGVLPNGLEEGTTKRRHLFTLNCQVTLSSVSTQ